MKEDTLQSAPRYGRRFALLIALFAAVFLASFVVGRYSVPLGTTLRILWSDLVRRVTFGRILLMQTWSDTEGAVVLNVRLPRGQPIRECSAIRWSHRI